MQNESHMTPERCRKMFGEFDSIAALDEAIEKSIYVVTGGRHDGSLLMAMSYLSDVQELLAQGPQPPTPDRLEMARQWINIAKYIISTNMGREVTP